MSTEPKELRHVRDLVVITHSRSHNLDGRAYCFIRGCSTESTQRTLPRTVAELRVGIRKNRNARFNQWLSLTNPISQVIAIKLGLLILTVGFAIDARLRVIPKLSEKNLSVMAWHIVPVTFFSVFLSSQASPSAQDG